MKLGFRWSRALAVIMAIAMLLLAALPAGAAKQPPYLDAMETLQAFAIVQGDAGTGDLRLGDPINRAETMKVLVVASGKGELADLLKGTAPFSDVAGHWAEGLIAMGKQLGLTEGYPDGTFRPKDPVKYSEVLALLVRLAGLSPKAGLTWPMNYFQAAADAGIVQGMPLEAVLNQPATRGPVFQLLHNTMFYVKGADGKTIYARNFDSQAPALTANAEVVSSSPLRVRVSGSVTDNKGLSSLKANGTAINVAADGNFSAELGVTGSQVAVVAADVAGNTSTREIAVNVAGPAARIIAPASLQVPAGTATPVAVQVQDANGVAVPNPNLIASVQGNVGTFDTATLTFKAVPNAGTGTITLTAGSAQAVINVVVTSGALRTLVITPQEVTLGTGQQTQLKASGTDQFGNQTPVTAQWCVVGGTGGTQDCPTGGNIFVDTNTGNVIGGFPGKYTIMARADGVTALAVVRVHGVATDVQISGPTTLVGNNATEAEVLVRAVDAQGTTVLNYTRPISLTSPLSGLSIEAVGETENGVAKFKVKTTDSGLTGVVVTLTAESVDGSETYQDTAELEIVLQEPMGVTIEAPKFLAANTGAESIAVKAYVVDQNGKPMLDGAYDVDFRASGPATLVGASGGKVTHLYFGDDPPDPAEATLSSVKGETGTVRVTATVDGVGTAEFSVQATIAGQAALFGLSTNPGEGRAAHEDWLVVNVQVTDSKGVPVAGPADAVAQFTVSAEKADELEVAVYNPDTDSWGGTTSLSGENPSVDLLLSENGVGKVRVRAWQYTGSLEVAVKATNMATARTNVKFVAAEAQQVGFTSPGVVVAAADAKGTLKAQVYDEAGNPAALAGVSVRFTSASSSLTMNGKKSPVTVRTDANGVAAIEASTPPYVETHIIVLDTTTLDEISGQDTAYFQVVPVPPKNIAIEFRDGGGSRRTSVPAGEYVYLRATVTDAYGTGVSGFASLLSGKVLQGGLDDDDIDFVDSGNGLYVAEIRPTKWPRLSVEVKLDLGASQLTQTANLNVSVGPAARVYLKRAKDSDPVNLVQNKIGGPFTIQVTDEFGNEVRSPDDVIVSFATSGLSGSFNVRRTPDGVTLTEVTIPNGSRGVQVYMVTSDPDGLTLILDGPGGYDSDSVTINVQ